MTFFRAISILFVCSGFITAVLIYIDIRQRRQPMKIMEIVWPLTGLWASWLGLWAYWKFGRAPVKPPMDMTMMNASENPEGPMRESSHSMQILSPGHSSWQQVTLSTLHCGAGCTLADIIGEWFVFFIPVVIGGSLIAGQWVLDYVLALILGIFFQYAAIQPMEHLPRHKALVKAVKVDFFSLTSWQIGMYGWMAVVIFAIRSHSPFPKTSWEFWFMMQVAMYCGFLTSYPVNRLLIRKGIKHGM